MAKKSSTKWPSPNMGAFILAGGRSRRMGQDKASLPWNGGTLLEHMLLLVSTVSNDVRVVGRGELPDRLPDLGPLGGILTALEVSKADRNLFLAVDLPLVSPDFLRMFCGRLATSNAELLACRIGSDYPLCLGVRRTLLPVIAARVDRRQLAVRDLIESADSEILTEEDLRGAGADPKIFASMNTPGEWQQLNETYTKITE